MSATPKPAVFELPWMPVVKSRIPENVQLLWVDLEGSYHLGRRKGDYVLPETYGNSEVVYRRVKDHLCYQRIAAPKAITP
jgi:hypothetical protein